MFKKDNGKMPTVSREIDAIVNMMLDATYHYQQPLSLGHLLGWHRAIIPDGCSGLYRIKVGNISDAGNLWKICS